jgi:hypothetical protein
MILLELDLFGTESAVLCCRSLAFDALVAKIGVFRDLFPRHLEVTDSRL